MRVKADRPATMTGAALCLLLSLLSVGRAEAQGELQEIRAKYQQEQYAEVAEELLQLRKSKSSTPEADYMLATSLCRAGQKERGAALLTWMGSEWSQGASYRLSPSIRKALALERQVCSNEQQVLVYPPFTDDAGGSFTDTTAVGGLSTDTTGTFTDTVASGGSFADTTAAGVP
jgi:hypothetical protein